MTALSQDELAELGRTIAELEQRLESSFAAHDEAITAKLNEVYTTEPSALDPICQSIQSRSVKN